MRMRLMFVVLASGGFAMAQGCSGVSDPGLLDGSTDATTSDVAPPADGGPDGSVTDSAPPPPTDGGGDAIAVEAGPPEGGPKKDAGPTVSFQCGSGTVTECSQCPNSPQPCVYCEQADASVMTGVCTALHTNCVNSLPIGFVDCPCQSATACPESYQVCTTSGGGRCHTCSDAVNNNGLTCENGGTCDAVDGGCL